MNVLHGWIYFCVCWATMVVLETATATPTVGLLDPLDSYNNRSSMKLLPKRFINIHQWLGPICAKQLKETLVSSMMPCSYRRRHVMCEVNENRSLLCGRSVLHVATGVCLRCEFHDSCKVYYMLLWRHPKQNIIWRRYSRTLYSLRKFHVLVLLVVYSLPPVLCYLV